ncbi:MAG: tetratricopeptide repeat protein, partial [Anaerolineae bacterium]|nr:tetratricopeptide repeat protein [Anaerolineae bacterium]
MSDVFISYSRQDREFITRLHGALADAEVDPWVDWEDIVEAEDWFQAICDGIDAAQKLICVISPAWLISENCHREMAYARQQHKTIIPVIYQQTRVEDVGGHWFDKPWEQAARENWRELQRLQWIDFKGGDDFDTGLAKLLTAIATDRVHERFHARILTQASDWGNAGRATTRMLRGADLITAEQWLAEHKDRPPLPTDLMREYIAASRREVDARAAEDARRQRLIRQLGQVAAAAALVSVVALILVGLALNSQQDAIHDREAAENAQAAADRRSDAAEQLGFGLWDFSQGNVTTALTFYDQAIAIGPDYPLAYNVRGIAYADRGEYARAIEDYDQAIALDPEYAAAYNNRGYTYFNQGKYARAIEDYDQAIVLNPEDALAYNNRGYTYFNQGEYARAIADYDQAIALDPRYAVAYYNRGNAYADQEEYARAIADYNQAVVLNA